MLRDTGQSREHLPGPGAEPGTSPGSVSEGAHEDLTVRYSSDGSEFSAGLSVDDDAGSSTESVAAPQSAQSLRSSIYDYVEENGRTYHKYKQGRYWMPNDEVEQDRLDLQHAILTMRLGGELGLAPVKSPRAVLDVGTGTGIWAIECATKYPSAKVIGTDLSPIQPAHVPPNCSFEVGDAEDEWGREDKFDYIHLRMMFHCFRDHWGVMRSAFGHLHPGGYMEWQDWLCDFQSPDGTLRGTALERWSRLYAEAARNLGRDALAPARYKEWMREAGFVDVVEKKLALPGSPWPRGKENKAMGRFQMANFLDGIHAVSMALFTRGLGWTPGEVAPFLEEVREAIRNPGVHFYFLIYVVYGRRPANQAP